MLWWYCLIIWPVWYGPYYMRHGLFRIGYIQVFRSGWYRDIAQVRDKLSIDWTLNAIKESDRWLMSFRTSPVTKDLINEWSYGMVLYQFRSDRTLGLNWTNYISISAIKKQTNIYFLHQKHKTIKKLSNFSIKNELWSNSLWETGLETIDKSNEHWYVVCIRDPQTVRSETDRFWSQDPRSV